MTPYFLSVDPGNYRAGFCLWVDGKISGSGVLTGNARKKQSIQSLEVDGVIDCYQPTALVIEGQYGATRVKGKDGKPHILVQTLIAITESRMRWQVAAELRGIPVIPCPPKTWQSKILGFAKSQTRDDLAKAAVKFCKSKYGIDAEQDEAQAICIGAWAINAGVLK